MRNDKPHIFLGAGPTKTGTDWLYHLFSEHPQVEMPPFKELSYFYIRQELGPNLNWRKHLFSDHWLSDKFRMSMREIKERHINNLKGGNIHFKNLIWDFKYLYFTHSDEWYLSLFDKNKTSGDISPMYSMLGEKAIAHISDLVPDAKIIIGLRDPIERMWSHIKMMYFTRRKLQLNELLENKEAIGFLTNSGQANVNDYVALVKKWEKYFPSSQICIYFYDDLVNKPQSLYETLCAFLGLEVFENDLIGKRTNVGPKEALPLKFKEILIEKNVPLIQEMCKYFDSPVPEIWLKKYI